MAAVFGWIGKWRGAVADAVPAAAPPALERSPGEMIAGCEYELRQLRRDVVATRESRSAPSAITREPFVLGARLRDETFRAKIPGVTLPLAPDTGSGAQ